ncbi:HIT domain-containing protein [bacterium]|nr:HIT domain-containing protein [bacterium]
MGSSSRQDQDPAKILWAPWRMEYIEHCGTPEKGCIFCDKPKQNDDRSNLILLRGGTVYVIMNRFPYNNGHLMVVPFRHTSDMGSLTDGERSEMFEQLEVCRTVLTRVMQPHGFNIGMNLGRVAGAGIADHLHFHIVPRWDGDTNFMPILGHTKVVSEGLERTWDKIRDALKS